MQYSTMHDCMYCIFNNHSKTGKSKVSEGLSQAKLKHFGREDFENVNKVENITDAKDCKYMTRPKENLSYYMCLLPLEKDKFLSGV